MKKTQKRKYSKRKTVKKGAGLFNGIAEIITPEGKIVREVPGRGFVEVPAGSVSTPVENHLDVGWEVVTANQEIGKILSSKYNKNLEKFVTVQIYDDDLPEGLSNRNVKPIKEYSEKEVKPITNYYQVPLNIAAYKRTDDSPDFFTILEKSIPDIPSKGNMGLLLEYLNKYILSKQLNINDVIFRTYPSTLMIFDIETYKMMEIEDESKGKMILNNVNYFKFQNSRSGIPKLEIFNYGRDVRTEQSDDFLNTTITNDPQHHHDFNIFTINLWEITNYFYAGNPYSIYLNKMPNNREIQKGLSSIIKTWLKTPLLSDLSKKLKILNNRENHTYKEMVDAQEKAYNTIKEMTKSTKKQLYPIEQKYNISQIANKITNTSKLEKIAVNNPSNTFINNVYKARVRRRIETIKNRKEKNQELLNIIASKIALSDNIPFFEEK
jgi:hypothetical protein